MSSITKSSVIEDRYIASLAGLTDGQKTIGHVDKYNAYYAKNHPISNTIASGFIGSLNGVAITHFGVLAYLLLNNDKRASIFGSAKEVCVSCGLHTRSITALLLNMQMFLTPKQGVSWMQQQLLSLRVGVGAAVVCVVDNPINLGCRVVNYVGGVQETISNNYMEIGAVTVGLIALFTYSKMNAYAAQERHVEKKLKHELTDRFEKIASRLKDLKSNPQIQECAKKILERKIEINKEIESLKLPNLTSKGIKKITQPVFDRAKKVCKRAKILDLV
ncbi:MAG: hypothetical protein H0X29_11055 [Parachlamydiaceae bacterium]|nr:hypothetical protein [Parachlamydiaceae bacterium]